MKKLTFILAIALIANVCNAASMEILVNGQDYTGQDVVASDIITVNWLEDNAYIYGGFEGLRINVSAGDYAAGTASLIGGLTLPSILVETAGDGFNVDITGTGLPFPTGIVATWDFHVGEDLEESSIILIDPTVGPYAGIYADLGGQDGLPYQELHVGVPEPATICLLGLGALSLIRRRRKA